MSSLDHYVSQVHLKNFYSPALGKLMYVFRKTDQKHFTANSASVCRTPDGSSNTYLLEPRSIEEFLKTIEPKYNESIDRLKENTINIDCIYAISGFISYVLTCSPAAMRIAAESFKFILKEEARILDKQGAFSKPPEQLGCNSVTELLETGRVKITVDHKYPQAIGISNILKLATTFGNSTWEVLLNEFEDSPFFTSDYPVAVETNRNPALMTRVFPLSPTLAVRIITTGHENIGTLDFTYKEFKYKVKKVSRKEISNINKLIVQCAEELVFYRDESHWTRTFLKKYRHFRVENVTSRLPMGTGALIVSTLAVMPHHSKAAT